MANAKCRDRGGFEEVGKAGSPLMDAPVAMLLLPRGQWTERLPTCQVGHLKRCQGIAPSFIVLSDKLARPGFTTMPCAGFLDGPCFSCVDQPGIAAKAGCG
ncbi:hypothetical protein ACFX5Q_05140 [Mesorhizobium sp. IMUNJ 23033]|uniref:hypothetical protein n=1 Tax=Mesorhizobium sp. IMUNJ 23033 TaxID=3378039 RepID=UPI00384A904E